MIASFVALVALAHQGGPNAGQLISRMLAHYGANKECKSLTGSITLTVSAANETAILDETVQFQRPSLIYVKQSLRSGREGPWILVSDGKHFSYNRPYNLPYGDNQETNFSKDRLVEAVNQNGVLYTLQDIYQAGGPTLKDRSMPLDIVFGRSQDLRFNVEKWATHELAGREEVRGIPAYIVRGQWRGYGIAPVSNQYRMWISEAGDLLRYEITGLTELSDGSGRDELGPQKVRSVWEIQLTPNAPVDETLFKL